MQLICDRRIIATLKLDQTRPHGLYVVLQKSNIMYIMLHVSQEPMAPHR